eukprot:Em0016g572a
MIIKCGRTNEASISVIDLEMAVSIPLFPPWCVVPPVDKICSFYGIRIPCVPAINFEDIFGLEVEMGHWITFILLVLIGILNLSRFLLIGAALHNLAEWSILIQVSNSCTTSTKIKDALRRATFFILTIVILVVMMPSLFLAVLVEQSFGIMLDFALPLLFWYMYVTGNERVRSFYQLPVVAHTVHLLFTILPLVFANFHVGITSWYSSFFLETAVYISGPITHVLYMKEATEKEKPADVIPTELRAKYIIWFLVAGYSLGLVPLVAVPFAMGPCQDTPHCAGSTAIMGTSVAVVHPGFGIAFQDMVSSKRLVERARAAKGNLEYELYGDVQDPDTFRFVEHWASRESLQAWMTEIHPLFQESAMKNLLVGEKLQQFGGYSYYQSSECRSVDSGAIFFEVGASCDKVWSVVSNWSDCSWVIGCDYAVITEPNTRRLHMKDGSTVLVVLRKLNKGNKELVYEVLQPFQGYTGSVNTPDTGSAPGCNATYRFTVLKNATPSADFVYADFLNIRVPGLKKLFKS